MRKTDFHNRLIQRLAELNTSIEGCPPDNRTCAIKHEIRTLNDELNQLEAILASRRMPVGKIVVMTRATYGHVIGFEVVSFPEFYGRWFPEVPIARSMAGKYIAIVEGAPQSLIPI